MSAFRYLIHYVRIGRKFTPVVCIIARLTKQVQGGKNLSRKVKCSFSIGNYEFFIISPPPNYNMKFSNTFPQVSKNAQSVKVLIDIEQQKLKEKLQ